MTDQAVLANLETACDELAMAQDSLATALHHAHLSALHSTYTASIKRIQRFNQNAINSTGNLLTTLKRLPAQQ